MNRLLAIAVFMSLSCFPIMAQETSVREKRAPIWVYLETVPGSTQKPKAPPIQELNDLARFVMSGMVYGWKFSYTPSDRARKVAEFFELIPIKEIEKNDPRFSLIEITPAYPRLESWAVVILDEPLKRRENYWSSVVFKTSDGRGSGERTAETQGIKTAYTEAVKNAIRGSAQRQVLNKPKEIRGEVQLRDNPRLFAEAGQFVADISVRINIQEIVPYTTF
jgi:hypothetical protein